MPPKARRNRGKVIDINVYNEDIENEDILDWAAQDWAADVPAQDDDNLNDNNTATNNNNKPARREYNRSANGVLLQSESFRTGERAMPENEARLSKLEPPYIAHFGNIRNNTTDEAFLKLFAEGTVERHWLINKDGKSFAFVEFKTIDALRFALMLNETFQRGRKMYVDIATEQQVDRLLNRNSGGSRMDFNNNNNNNSGSNSRMSSSMMTGASSPLANFSREDIGQAQPTIPRNNSSSGNMNSFLKAGSPFSAMEFSRDTFGEQQQPPAPSASAFGDRNNNNQSEHMSFRDNSRSGSMFNSRENSMLAGSSNRGSPLNRSNRDRSNFASKQDLPSMTEFSRDMLGSAVQPPAPDPNAESTNSPLSGSRNSNTRSRRNFNSFLNTANQNRSRGESNNNDNNEEGNDDVNERSNTYNSRHHVGAHAESMLANWRNEERLVQPEPKEPFASRNREANLNDANDENAKSSGFVKGNEREERKPWKRNDRFGNNTNYPPAAQLANWREGPRAEPTRRQKDIYNVNENENNNLNEDQDGVSGQKNDDKTPNVDNDISETINNNNDVCSASNKINNTINAFDDKRPGFEQKRANELQQAKEQQDDLLPPRPPPFPSDSEQSSAGTAATVPPPSESFPPPPFRGGRGGGGRGSGRGFGRGFNRGSNTFYNNNNNGNYRQRRENASDNATDAKDKMGANDSRDNNENTSTMRNSNRFGSSNNNNNSNNQGNTRNYERRERPRVQPPADSSDRWGVLPK